MSYKTTTVLDSEPANDTRPPWGVETVELADQPDYRGLHVHVDAEFDLTRGHGDRNVAYRVMNAVHDALYPATAQGMATGATYVELVDLLQLWHKVLAATPTNLIPICVRKHTSGVRGLVEVVGNLHTEAGPDRSSEPIAEHRREVGLCPDGDEHWYIECRAYECPTWRNDRDADYVGCYR